LVLRPAVAPYRLLAGFANAFRGYGIELCAPEIISLVSASSNFVGGDSVCR
jgi:hypothetical protein